MPKFFRNVGVFILGLAIGSLVNIALVLLGSWLIPAPAGVDTASTESLAQSIHLLGPQHFVFPFLAHALGTFAGAVVAFKFAASRPVVMAFVVGTLFFAGGIAAASMIPAPIWFLVMDLLLAYLPMAWLATKLVKRSAISDLAA